MHAVTRTYIGHGAKELFDLLEQRKAEVEKILRGVEGFQSYLLLRTEDGGVSVTVCKDKAGTDESIIAARDWVAKNTSELDVRPPVVSEGPVLLQLS